MQMSLASTSSSENVAAKLILHQDCARPSMIRDNLLGLCPNFSLKAHGMRNEVSEELLSK